MFVDRRAARAAAAAATDPGLAGLRASRHSPRRREAHDAADAARGHGRLSPDRSRRLWSRCAAPTCSPCTPTASPIPATWARSCARRPRFAAAALITSPGCVDLFSPKVVRGSMGAVFALPLYREVQLAEAARELGAARVYGLVAHDGAPLWSVELVRPARRLRRRRTRRPRRAGVAPGQRCVTIPLAEGGSAGVESLNAGVAGAVALYEFARRAATGGRSRATPRRTARGREGGDAARRGRAASPRSGRRRPAEGKE